MNNDTQPNDTQHTDNQYYNITNVTLSINDTQHNNTKCLVSLCSASYEACHNAEYYVFIVMLTVAMLSVVMLSVIMLSVAKCLAMQYLVTII